MVVQQTSATKRGSIEVHVLPTGNSFQWDQCLYTNYEKKSFLKKILPELDSKFENFVVKTAVVGRNIRTLVLEYFVRFRTKGRT